MKQFTFVAHLVLWNIVAVILPLGLFFGALYFLQPEVRSSTVWAIIFLGPPAGLTLILCPPLALLGAWLGGRLPQPVSTAQTGQDPASRAQHPGYVETWVGAGIGGMLGAALPLAYLAWLFQGGGGAAIFLFGTLYIFAVFAGCVAYLRRSWRRRSPAVATPTQTHV